MAKIQCFPDALLIGEKSDFSPVGNCRARGLKVRQMDVLLFAKNALNL